MVITALVFLLLLSILVLIHELGHFFMARRQGIKVEEFGFGLPPRALSKKIGETIYSLNWLPIGGFVKLYGEDEAGEGKLKIKDQRSKIKDNKRAFFAKSPWQRASVVIAGVVMNSILAVIIFYIFLFISGFKAELPLIGNHQFFFANQEVNSDIIISGIAKNSPADKAGIKPMSKIIAVNDQKIKDTETLVAIINKSKGKNLKISWQDVKTNKTFTAVVIPRLNPPQNEGAMGVSFFPVSMATLKYETPMQKIFSGITHPVNLLVYNFDVMGKLIAVSFKEKTVAPLGESVSGPVGVYSIVGDIVRIPDAKERFLQILNLAGILSISLAFFNILPFPALDGGRLFFILFEGITGKKVNPRYETMIHSIGMMMLLGLIALVTFHDLLRIFSSSASFFKP